jgi:GDP-L-fucose synthase
VYPKLAPQPIREESLLTGPLEPTNEPYAIAKIAGLKLVEAARRQYGMQWVSLMPSNLYGPGDNFDLVSSHVLPAMIRKFDDGVKSGGPVTLWGSGTVRREFLHVDDLARAALHISSRTEVGLMNVGWGEDVTIRELALMVAEEAGYSGEILWDRSMPDGTPRKLLDTSRIRTTGWEPVISLRDGIRNLIAWYRSEAISVKPGNRIPPSLVY